MQLIKLIGGRLLAIAFGLLFAIFIAELAVRLFVSPAQWRLQNTGDDWTYDAELGWDYTANLDAESTFLGEYVHFQTNTDGIIPATATRERPADTFRVMLIGDSTTAARNVPQDETLQVYLEALVQEIQSADVINAGVEGYSTDQVLLRMQRLLPIYKPNVVIYTFTVNDLGGNSTSRAWGVAKPYFELTEDGRLTLIPPIGEEFSPFPETFSPRWILVRSALWRFMQPMIVPIRAKLEGWESLVAAPGLYYYDEEFLDNFDWDILEALIQEMNRHVTEQGAVFMLTGHAQLDEVWLPHIESAQANLIDDEFDFQRIERRLMEIAARNNIPFCPYVDYFLDNQTRGPFHLLNDSHNNGVGYEVKAETLRDCLIVNDVISS